MNTGTTYSDPVTDDVETLQEYVSAAIRQEAVYPADKLQQHDWYDERTRERIEAQLPGTTLQNGASKSFSIRDRGDTLVESIPSWSRSLLIGDERMQLDETTDAVVLSTYADEINDGGILAYTTITDTPYGASADVTYTDHPRNMDVAGIEGLLLPADDEDTRIGEQLYFIALEELQVDQTTTTQPYVRAR